MLSKPHHGLSFLLLSAAAFTLPVQAAVPDADAQQQIEANEERFLQVAGFTPAKDIDDWFDQEWYDEQRFPEANPRSEERRVGNERRARCGREPSKKRRWRSRV